MSVSVFVAESKERSLRKNEAHGNSFTDLDPCFLVCGCHDAEALPRQYFTQAAEFFRIGIDDKDALFHSEANLFASHSAKGVPGFSQY